MFDQIILSATAWLVPFCLVLGLIYAAILYLFERKFEFSAQRRYFMAAIRTAVVAMISFFLFSPLLRQSNNIVSKPIVIVAQDNSSSIVACKDSLFYKLQYPHLLNQLISALEKDFEVHTYSFGQQVRPGISYSFDDKQTDIAELMSDLNERYVNRNVGAVIMASDGIYNYGVHPFYAVQHVPYSYYSIALGDTLAKRDALIVRTNHNRIAYLGNTFPVEVAIKGLLCNGLNSRFQVLHKGITLYSENIRFEGNEFDKLVQFELNASEPGLHRYTLTLQPVNDENTNSNNVKDIFIEVLEGKQNVLILHSSPHPDISALHQAIASHENYEVTVSDASQFQGNLSAYNLVILHQMPSHRNSYRDLIKQLGDRDIPMLFILGSTTAIEAFNTLQIGLSITGITGQPNESLPVLNKSFKLFTLSQELSDLIKTFPPLYCPAGSYKTSGPATVLFYQQIGSQITDMPLIITTEMSGKKKGAIAGEGIWRWRMANFARNGNHRAFDMLVGKLVQYLSLREEKSRFRVSVENIWRETDAIEFTAEFYNTSFEPVKDHEIELTLTDEAGKSFQYAFSPTGNSYFLNTGLLSPGNYTYTARTVFQQEAFNAKGAFTVLPLQAEMASTIADHHLLFGLAQRYGGQMVLPAEMMKLAAMLASRDDIKPLIQREMKYRELIDVGWLLLALLALLSAEWVLRRTAGGY